MIVWLDGGQNVKGRLNEYLPRAVRLFALGGNYSEQGHSRAARAFGLASTQRPVSLSRIGTTVGRDVCSERGPLDGEDVITDPAAGCSTFRHCCNGEFLCAAAGTARGGRRRAAARNRLRHRAVCALLAAAEFSVCAWRARIKSPVEYAIGIVPRDVAWPGPPSQPVGQRCWSRPSRLGRPAHLDQRRAMLSG